MRRAIIGILTAAAVFGTGMPAGAVDLSEAKRDAQVVSRALAFGRKGEWSAAEAAASSSKDALVRDLVLWRKLRAGAGSVREYQSFVNRRGTFPGMDVLAQVVTGRRTAVAGRSRPELTGAAKDRWATLTKLWKADKFDEAEKALAGFSTSSAALGNPARWADRRARLARRAMREGRTGLAYKLASRHYTQPDAGYAYSDLEWLSGWIALRGLKNPDVAMQHFLRFQASVETPISLSRAGYWLGRAWEAKGQASEARRAYAQAAQYQTAFYGQLAAEKIGAAPDDRLATRLLPDRERVPSLRGDDLRAMAILELAGESSLAEQMFHHKAQALDDPNALGGLAALALELGRPHYAVRIAKTAARKGVILPPAYYPLHELASYVDRVEPALAMAIARQETELNPDAVSHAGARGLMQVMPATAKLVAQRIGEPYSMARLTQDWRYNARLGQAYLAHQVAAFGGSYVLAAAAYNAGPHRVRQWRAEYGDPGRDLDAIVDWIENIPFNETRNYVQRVSEALWVYRTRLSGKAQPLRLSEDLQRGLAG